MLLCFTSSPGKKPPAVQVLHYDTVYEGSTSAMNEYSIHEEIAQFVQEKRVISMILHQLKLLILSLSSVLIDM